MKKREINGKRKTDMFLLILFFLIMAWVVGYSPFIPAGRDIITLGNTGFGLQELLLLAGTLALVVTLPKPFRQTALGLLIIWSLPYIGIPMSAGFSGAFLAAGISAIGSRGDTENKIMPKKNIIKNTPLLQH